MSTTEKQDLALLRHHSAIIAARHEARINNQKPEKSIKMKTLLLYVGGVKCHFSGGNMIVLTPAQNHQEWFRANKGEIAHYKQLTSKTV